MTELFSCPCLPVAMAALFAALLAALCAAFAAAALAAMASTGRWQSGGANAGRATRTQTKSMSNNSC